MGPRSTQCTSCVHNDCAQQGACSSLIFPILDGYEYASGGTGACVSACPAGRYVDSASV